MNMEIAYGLGRVILVYSLALNYDSYLELQYYNSGEVFRNLVLAEIQLIVEPLL